MLKWYVVRAKGCDDFEILGTESDGSPVSWHGMEFDVLSAPYYNVNAAMDIRDKLKRHTAKYAIAKMYTKLSEMSDKSIRDAWTYLDYHPGDMWDTAAGITMSEWAHALYHEKSRRGL